MQLLNNKLYTLADRQNKHTININCNTKIKKLDNEKIEQLKA